MNFDISCALADVDSFHDVLIRILMFKHGLNKIDSVFPAFLQDPTSLQGSLAWF